MSVRDPRLNKLMVHSDDPLWIEFEQKLLVDSKWRQRIDEIPNLSEREIELLIYDLGYTGVACDELLSLFFNTDSTPNTPNTPNTLQEDLMTQYLSIKRDSVCPTIKTAQLRIKEWFSEYVLPSKYKEDALKEALYKLCLAPYNLCLMVEVSVNPNRPGSNVNFKF